jgi:TusA-related sulfurtransferase
MWLQKWFGDADELHVLNSSVDQIVDRIHTAYRFRLRNKLDWQLAEQQAYCTVDQGLIGVMNLLCSGFRPDPKTQDRQAQSAMNHSSGQGEFGAGAFYDAGPRGCAEGPLDEIGGLMRQLASGQTLEVRAFDPSVTRDLPAWFRLVGYDLVKHEGDRYLIRHR